MSEILYNIMIAELIWLVGRQHRRLPRAANTVAPPLVNRQLKIAPRMHQKSSLCDT